MVNELLKFFVLTMHGTGRAHIEKSRESNCPHFTLRRPATEKNEIVPAQMQLVVVCGTIHLNKQNDNATIERFT